MPIQTALPTRVVYVGTDNHRDPPRLHLSNGQIAGYLALSYCWGGKQDHQTERTRIGQYMRALPLEALPKTIRDAIIFTRALGIQYIWIDSLCIIQDSQEDKEHELSRVANIYKGAVLTISAARASSCYEGFLGLQEDRIALLQDSVTLPMNNLDGVIGNVLFYHSRLRVRRDEDTPPIDLRAWTYQEQLLSPRVVSFHKDAMEWSCPSLLLSDDGMSNEELQVTDPVYLRLTEPFLKRTSYLSPLFYCSSQDLDKYPEHLASLSEDWWTAVYEYTLGLLSDLDDRLPAIAGIASEFHRITGDTYIAGLWRSSLSKDLLWRCAYMSASDTGSRTFKYNAPTWSWASTHQCAILYTNKKYPVTSSRVEILDCKVDLASSLAPFGPVHGGRLQIRAPLKFLSDTEVDEMLRIGPHEASSKKSRLIGRVLSDRPTEPQNGGTGQVEDLGVWFLGLSKNAQLPYESHGLTLKKRPDGLFERTGIFEIDSDNSWWGNVRTAELDKTRASWGDDYVVTVMTIV